MNKSQFIKTAIDTRKKDFGKSALNRLYKKRNKKLFVRDYVISLYGFSTASKEATYLEEYESDALLIQEAGGFYEHIVIGKKVPEGKLRVRKGFFVQTYTDEVSYLYKGYETTESVLVIVPSIPLF